MCKLNNKYVEVGGADFTWRWDCLLHTFIIKALAQYSDKEEFFLDAARIRKDCNVRFDVARLIAYPTESGGVVVR